MSNSRSDQTPVIITVEDYLKSITDDDGTINLSNLKKFNGGGTHDIYRSEKYPAFLLKVMKRTTGKDITKLSNRLHKLNNQYSILYEIFTHLRCIVEKRSIQSIKLGDHHNSPQKTIVSIVPFDPCFDSKEKFGFNVHPAERDGKLINSKRYLYGLANKSLLGNQRNRSPYVMKNYSLLNKEFKNIFQLLETDQSLVVAMREFLTKYKLFYQKTGILLDTIGFDNVLFYKVDCVWQFKLGSVIKHDTSELTKQMLDEIKKDPSIVNNSLKAYTSIYFMPACIRALNACAMKIGMEKIINDIMVDEKTIDILAEIHLQLGEAYQIINCAAHEEFSEALKRYRQYVSDDQSDDTEMRDMLGTSYWDYIKNGGKENSREEVQSYLNILLDERNHFPKFREQIVAEAIEELMKRVLSFNIPKTVSSHTVTPSQSLKFFDPSTKNIDQSESKITVHKINFHQ